MNTVASLEQLVNPYYQFSRNATLNTSLSDLIDDLTNESGKQPSSEGVQYVVDRVTQYITREYVQNISLQKLKNQTIADKYAVKHLLNLEKTPPKHDINFIKAMDNHISILDSLMAVNAPFTTAKLFYLTATGIAALATIASHPVNKSQLSIWSLGFAAAGLFTHTTASSKKEASDYNSHSVWDAQQKTLKEKLFENLTIFTTLEDKQNN